MRDRLLVFDGYVGRFHGESGEIVGRQATTPELVELSALAADHRRRADDLSLGELRDLAAAEAVLGDSDTAVRRLELLTLEHPDEAAAWCDLSAVLLMRHASGNDPLDLVHAATAAGTARRLDPACAAAGHNAGLARQGLGLQPVPSGPPTSGEAPVRRAETNGRPGLADWKGRERELLDKRGDLPRTDLARLVEDYPLYTRQLVLERLLPAWAEAERDGGVPDAGWSLELALTLGDLHRASLGEHMIADAVAALRAAGAQDRESAIVGHALFGAGRRHYEEQSVREAEREFSESRVALERIGSPLALWAAFHGAICTYFRDADEGRRAFLEIEQQVAGKRYDALAGRVQWMLGTIDVVQGRLALSMERYRRAFDLLERSSGPAATAFIDTLMAESLSRTGAFPEAWQHRIRALREVPHWEESRRKIAMLTEAGVSLIIQERCDLALVLLDEAVRVGHGWGAPLGISTALSVRARCQVLLGRTEEARADIAAARAAIERMEEGALRSMQDYIVSLAEGQLLTSVDPQSALGLLTRSFSQQDAKGYNPDRIPYLMGTAQAARALGDHGAFLASAEEAIAEYERLATQSTDPYVRVTALRNALPAFRSLAAASLGAERPPYPDTFARAERQRLAIASPRRLSSSFTAQAGLDQVQDLLDDSVAVVAYAVLDERLVVWTVTAETLNARVIPIPRERLANLVERYLHRTRLGEQGLDDVAHALWENVVEPIGLGRLQVDRLVVIPDSVLARLPFPVLRDPDTGRHLIETHAVALSPTLSMLLDAPTRRPRDTANDALIVGVGSTFSEKLALPVLQGVEQEVELVARSFASPVILREQGASRSVVQSRLAAGYAVVHFAGHAVPSSQLPIDSGIALSATADREDRAVLSVADLVSAEQRIRIDLFVLSSCATLPVDTPENPALLGFASALAHAGVTAVVASRWESDDRVGPNVMSDLHSEYSRGLPAAEALRRAILHRFREPSGRLVGLSHWAGLTVLGGLGAIQGGDDAVRSATLDHGSARDRSSPR